MRAINPRQPADRSPCSEPGGGPCPRPACRSPVRVGMWLEDGREVCSVSRCHPALRGHAGDQTWPLRAVAMAPLECQGTSETWSSDEGDSARSGSVRRVNLAIEALDPALETCRRRSTSTEIVDNKYVVDHPQGVTFVDDLAEVRQGTPLFGQWPEIRRIARERRLPAIDATCPLVTKVHLEAIKCQPRLHDSAHRREDHEVIGTMGEAGRDAGRVARRGGPPRRGRRSGSSRLSRRPPQRRRREPDHRPSEAVPADRLPPKDDIRYATQNRQEAVAKRARPSSRSCWAARTARTASG